MLPDGADAALADGIADHQPTHSPHTNLMSALPNPELLFATADQTLLAPYGLDTPCLTQVFGQIMSHQIDYADLYFQYSRGESWSLEEGIVKSGSFNIEQGVGVRAVSGDRTAFAYSDDISLPALESAAAATRAIARQGGEATTQVARRSEGRALYLPHDPVASLKDPDKVALLERLERYAAVIGRREERLLTFLTEAPRSLDEIADHRFVYRPSDPIPFAAPVERRSMGLHLERLVRQGRVREEEPDKFRATAG